MYAAMTDALNDLLDTAKAIDDGAKATPLLKEWIKKWVVEISATEIVTDKEAAAYQGPVPQLFEAVRHGLLERVVEDIDSSVIDRNSRYDSSKGFTELRAKLLALRVDPA